MKLKTKLLFAVPILSLLTMGATSNSVYACNGCGGVGEGGYSNAFYGEE